MATAETLSQDAAALRKSLLDAVEDIRETLESSAEDSDEGATLAPAAVSALQGAGMFNTKLPTTLGGTETDPITFMDILEAISYIDTSSGWCTFVGANAVGRTGACLPEAGLQSVFPNGHIPLMAIVVMPGGTAVPEKGGYRLTGHWRFCSTICHSEWVVAGAAIKREGDGTGPPELLTLVLPTADVEIHDNWQVMGLKGTGSCDMSVSELFVPEELTYPHGLHPLRGGDSYRISHMAFIAHEHAAYAAGVGRRAIDELISLANTGPRSRRRTPLNERPVFYHTLSRLKLKLRSTWSLLHELYEEVWDNAKSGRETSPMVETEIRAATAYITEVGIEIATQAFRYGGAGGLYTPNIFDRLLRDMVAGGQHAFVSDEVYDEYAKAMLGLELKKGPF